MIGEEFGSRILNSWLETRRQDPKFLDNPRLSIESFSAYLGPVIKKEWKRKEFKDFDYIRTELGGWDYVIILVLVLIYLGLISTWILRNEFENVN